MYWIHGEFDGYHYGHVWELYGLKLEYGNVNVLIETISTDSLLYSTHERTFMLSNCKYVTQIDKQPTNISNITRSQFDISDKTKHASLQDMIEHSNMASSGMSQYSFLYKVHCKQHGHIVPHNLYHILLEYMFNTVNNKQATIRSNKPIMLVIGNWDYVQPSDVHFINNLNVHFNVVCYVNNNYTFFHNLEISIILASLTNVSFVTTDPQSIHYSETCTYKQSTSLDVLTINPTHLHVYNQRIDHFKKLKNIYLDSGLYHQTLELQYQTISNMFKQARIEPNEIVMMDLDEVVLCNLPYINDFMYAEHLDKEYFKHGINSLISQSHVLFETFHERKIKYFFVTGRRDFLRDKTIENLQHLKYQFLYTRNNNCPKTVGQYKMSCALDVIKKGFNITHSIGDQISDLGCGIPLLIFNPFYKL